MLETQRSFNYSSGLTYASGVDENCERNLNLRLICKKFWRLSGQDRISRSTMKNLELVSNSI